jgi:D-hydroxyproline dehydrogenase subunit alpha
MRKHFDVLVVGAGPAGIAAAVTASQTVQKVALMDDNPAPGGQIWRSGAPLPASAEHWLERLARSSVERLSGWHVFDQPAEGRLSAECEGQLAEFSFDKLIVATGARELFLPFPGWTLPNVFGAGALDAMARGGFPMHDKRVVLAGTGPLLLAVAAHLAKRGARIVAICEQASLASLLLFGATLVSHPSKLKQALYYRWATRKSPLYTECWPIAARGEGRLREVALRQGRAGWTVNCDYLGCGFHLTPNLELARLLGCRILDGFVATDDWQQSSIPRVYCAGELTGIGGVELALIEGQIAGFAASEQMDRGAPLIARRHRMRSFVRRLRGTYVLDPRLRNLAAGDTLVCRCEDVPWNALERLGSFREAKLHTRCGMGPCQGRVCGAAGEFLFGWTVDSVRPPLFPVLLSSLASEREVSLDQKEQI